MSKWTKMSLEDVKKRVIAAICALYRHDRELLAVDANERSITHKLAEHLQREFPEWHVDCEYNRVGHLGDVCTKIDSGATQLGERQPHAKGKRGLSMSGARKNNRAWLFHNRVYI